MAQLGREDVHDLYPEDVAKGITEGKILLVDVREPNETEIERYPEPVVPPARTWCSRAAPAIARSPLR